MSFPRSPSPSSRAFSAVFAARSSRRAGFTLVELLVAVTLAMLLSGSITFVAMQTNRIYQYSVAKVDLYARIRYAFNLLENELSRMVATSDLEFFKDQRGDPTRSNNHWDPGEEVRTAFNTAGGYGGDNFYNEAPHIVERSYVRNMRRGAPEEHAAFEIYFRAPVQLGDRVLLANVEYRLVEAEALVNLRSTGKNSFSRTVLPDVHEVDERAELSLVRIIRYIKPGMDIVTNDFWTRLVECHITEICSNVISFKIEYYARNPYRGSGGASGRADWYTPQLDFEKPLEPVAKAVQVPNTSPPVYVKEFMYGTSRMQPSFGRERALGLIRRAIKVDPQNPAGRGVPPEFQVLRLQFAELATGDKIYLWRNSAGDYFEGGEFTIRNIVNGRLRFVEPVETSSWRGDRQGVQFKAAYLPMAVRVTVVLSDRQGEHRHEVQRVVRMAIKSSA